jgi:hypothetical protein
MSFSVKYSKNYNTSHKIGLSFTLDPNAPPKWQRRWIKLKQMLMDEDQDRLDFLNKWKMRCKEVSNQQLPILVRCEGVLGGDNNQIHKQLRGVDSFIPMAKNDKGIYFLASVASKNSLEQWSFDELLDLKNAFIMVANERLEEECVYGWVTIE